MSPHTDGATAKHRSTRAKTARRSSSKQANETVAVAVCEIPKPSDLAGREARIRLAAYLRAESRGFVAGHELDDWLLAEAEIDRLIAIEAALP